MPAAHDNHTSEQNAPESEIPGFRENYLLFQLAFISHYFSEDFHQYLRTQDMPPAKWRIMVSILDRPGIRVGALARNTLFEQSRVTKITDQLCQEKLITKKPDSVDRRKVNLYPTAAGKRKMLPMVEQAKHHEEKLMSQLDAEDVAHLKDILRKLVKPRLQEVNQPAKRK